MNVKDVTPEEYNPYYQRYIDLAEKFELNEGLLMRMEHASAFYNNIPEERWDYAYAEGKWTIKEVLLHIIDTERIFAYRALCIGRGDTSAFPGFDQDDYSASANANKRTKASLIEEFRAVRNATITLFNSLSSEDLTKIGTASNSPVSPRAIGFIVIGHEIHHSKVILERYL